MRAMEWAALQAQHNDCKGVLLPSDQRSAALRSADGAAPHLQPCDCGRHCVQLPQSTYRSHLGQAYAGPHQGATEHGSLFLRNSSFTVQQPQRQCKGQQGRR